MVAANLARVEIPQFSADALSELNLLRGVLYGLAFSLPMWGAIVAVARLVF